MKKIFTLFISFFVVFNICSCSNTNKKENVIYLHDENGDIVQEIELTDNFLDNINYDFFEKKPDEIYTYSFLKWDHDLSEYEENNHYFPIYTKEFNTFKVEFYDGNKMLKTFNVPYGKNALINAPKIEEKKPSQNEISYELFNGWKEENNFDCTFVTNNLKIHSTYSNVIRNKVEFLDYNGKIIQTYYVDDGESLNPVNYNEKILIDNKFLVFDKWDTLLTNIYDSIVIKPIMKELPAYKVDFYNYDNELLQTIMVPEGYDAEYNFMTPQKPSINIGDITYEYTFLGWDTPLDNITKDTIVKANYSEKSYNNYNNYKNALQEIRNHCNQYDANEDCYDNLFYTSFNPNGIITGMTRYYCSDNSVELFYSVMDLNTESGSAIQITFNNSEPGLYNTTYSFYSGGIPICIGATRMYSNYHSNDFLDFYSFVGEDSLYNECRNVMNSLCRSCMQSAYSCDYIDLSSLGFVNY